MEYSLRSNCLVTLFDEGDHFHDLAARSSALIVLDVAAGGRMLCRLCDDFMCVQQTLASCPAHWSVTVGHMTLRFAGRTTRSWRSQC